MGQCQLVPQARLTLAPRAGTPSNRRDVLTQTAVAALHQGGVDGPTQRTPYLIDGLNRAKDHTVRDVDSSPTPRGFDHLRIEPLRPGHPARLGPRPLGLTPRRLHPAPIVRQQGRQVRAKSVRHKERRTIGRQHLRDVVDEALRHGLGPLADVDGHQQLGHRIDRHPHPVRGTGQALDGLGLRELALLDGTEDGIPLIELQLLDVCRSQRKEAHKARRGSAASTSQCRIVCGATSKTRAVARIPSPAAKQASTGTISSPSACLP
jgi:hypothetical protein